MITRATAFRLAGIVGHMDANQGLHWIEVASRPFWCRLFPSTYQYRRGYRAA